MTNLGQEFHSATLAIHGFIDEAGAARLLHIVIKFIRMRPIFRATVWRYPAEDQGGEGETLVQPFALAQPLVESLSLVFAGMTGTDSWTEHEGFYLFIHSCRPFDIDSLITFLEKKGWKVGGYHTGMVALTEVKSKKKWWKFW